MLDSILWKRAHSTAGTTGGGACRFRKRRTDSVFCGRRNSESMEYRTPHPTSGRNRKISLFLMRSGALDASFVGAAPDPALKKSTTSYENQRQRKFSASGFWIFNKWPTFALPGDSHGQLFSSSSQYLHNTELPVLIFILRSEWFSICWKQLIFIVCPFPRFPAIKPPPLLVLHLSPVPRQIPIHLYKVQTLHGSGSSSHCVLHSGNCGLEGFLDEKMYNIYLCITRGNTVLTVWFGNLLTYACLWDLITCNRRTGARRFCSHAPVLFIINTCRWLQRVGPFHMYTLHNSSCVRCLSCRLHDCLSRRSVLFSAVSWSSHS